MPIEDNYSRIRSLYPWARSYATGGPKYMPNKQLIDEMMKSYEKFARGGNVGFGNLYEPGGRLGNFRQYNKAMNELEEKYGMASPSMGLSRREAKRQFRQNKAQMWDSYYKTKSVYDQLAAERPVEWNVEQRVANALGNSNDAMDAGNSVRSTMLARQYPVMKNYAEAQRRYWHPTDQERKNDIAERRDYRGMTPWLTLLAASPALFAGAPYAASAIEKAVPALGNTWGTAMGMNTVGANFMKNMIVGTAAGGGVELAAKPIVGKEFTPTMSEALFSKETRDKHPILTNLAASALNPGYYVGLGKTGLEYTGKLLPNLTKRMEKTGVALKDAWENYLTGKKIADEYGRHRFTDWFKVKSNIDAGRFKRMGLDRVASNLATTPIWNAPKKMSKVYNMALDNNLKTFDGDFLAINHWDDFDNPLSLIDLAKKRDGAIDRVFEGVKNAAENEYGKNQEALKKVYTHPSLVSILKESPQYTQDVLDFWEKNNHNPTEEAIRSFLIDEVKKAGTFYRGTTPLTLDDMKRLRGKSIMASGATSDMGNFDLASHYDRGNLWKFSPSEEHLNLLKKMPTNDIWIHRIPEIQGAKIVDRGMYNRSLFERIFDQEREKTPLNLDFSFNKYIEDRLSKELPKSVVHYVHKTKPKSHVTWFAPKQNNVDLSTGYKIERVLDRIDENPYPHGYCFGGHLPFYTKKLQ